MHAVHKTPSNKSPRKKLFILVAVALAVIIGVGAALEFTDTTDFINTGRSKGYATTPATSDRTINEKTKGEPEDSDKQQTATPENEHTKDPQPGSSQNGTLTTPTGPFVSNHHPNLSGSPAPNALQSTCTTTPGATCQIFFKNGNTTVSLPVQQTDKGGSAYWSWKLQDLDLSEGSWEVTAKAVFGNQTKTATDSMKLEVKE